MSNLNTAQSNEKSSKQKSPSIPLMDISDPAHYQADDLIINATQHNSAIRLVKGTYQKIRRWTAGPLIALFVLAPWLTLNSNPVLQMDLESRQLHLFGINFWPDDLLILTWVAMASAFALFAVANFAGRLWCGFTCPQTVWSMMFVWVEEHIEGSRNQRLKQQNAHKLSSFNTLVKRLAKHVVWLSLSFITGFTFVAFFETGPILFQGLINFDLQSDAVFWLVFFTSLTYINAGWLREQVCLHMCPYARFQSVMLDSKSLKVSYDVNRGEPRKSHFSNKQQIQNSTEEKTGDCVDCKLCVQVCPVGIDIRQGMQYACIDCGACIDACDDIMTKIQKPKGLIRFSNEQKQHWSHLFKNRTRLLGYSGLTVIALLGFVFQVAYMESFDAHLNRDRGQLFFYGNDGHIKNAYTLKIHNKTTQRQDYLLTLDDQSENTLKVESNTQISIQPGEKKTINLLLRCQTPCSLASRTPLILIVKDGTSESRLLETVFFNEF
jgi:cytochrome c oxidase accessory protein FixG